MLTLILQGSDPDLKKLWYLDLDFSWYPCVWSEIYVYLWTNWTRPISMDGFLFGHYTPQQTIDTTLLQIFVLDLLSWVCKKKKKEIPQDTLVCWRDEMLSVWFPVEIWKKYMYPLQDLHWNDCNKRSLYYMSYFLSFFFLTSLGDCLQKPDQT